MCYRARTPKYFQVRANMMIKKKSVKKFCCYDQKQQPPIFSHLLFFVAICCSNKKMLSKCCPTIKEKFLFRKFFSKTHFNVSNCKRVIMDLEGGIFWYELCICIICRAEKIDFVMVQFFFCL